MFFVFLILRIIKNKFSVNYRKIKILIFNLFGGAEGNRTPDLHNAIVALYQLSYDPDLPGFCPILFLSSRA